MLASYKKVPGQKASHTGVQQSISSKKTAKKLPVTRPKSVSLFFSPGVMRSIPCAARISPLPNAAVKISHVSRPSSASARVSGGKPPLAFRVSPASASRANSAPSSEALRTSRLSRQARALLSSRNNPPASTRLKAWLAKQGGFLAHHARHAPNGKRRDEQRGQ